MLQKNSSSFVSKNGRSYHFKRRGNKKRAFKLILFFLIIPIMNYCDIERIKPEKIDYFGQNPPGKTPEVFAPAIISTKASEGCSYFSKDGHFCLSPRGGSVEPDIFIMEQKEGIRSKPYSASFSASRHDWDFTLTLDEKYFFFTSNKIDNWDICLADVKIIKELKLKELVLFHFVWVIEWIKYTEMASLPSDF